jgi:phage repressor protein C with HTH and peptisase S24 domain
MGWATQLIEALKEGRTVQCRPRGGSMKGKIESGELVMIAPVAGAIAKGDIVLCRVGGREYLHLVKAIQGDRYLIGNNRGGINGWIGRDCIFGRKL